MKDIVDRDEWERQPTYARAQVVERWTPLVQSLARAFARSNPIEFDDAFQVGCEGLFKAVDGFDPNKGVPFSSYASIRIMGEMRDYQRKADHLSDRSRRAVNKLRRASLELARDLKRDPTVDELVERLGWSEERVREVKRRGSWTTVSYEDDVAEYVDPEEEALRNERMKKLQAAFLRLRTRTRNVVADVVMRERPAQDVAKELELTPGRISQLKSKGLEQLKGLMERSDWEIDDSDD